MEYFNDIKRVDDRDDEYHEPIKKVKNLDQPEAKKRNTKRTGKASKMRRQDAFRERIGDRLQRERTHALFAKYCLTPAQTFVKPEVVPSTSTATAEDEAMDEPSPDVRYVSSVEMLAGPVDCELPEPFDATLRGLAVAGLCDAMCSAGAKSVTRGFDFSRYAYLLDAIRLRIRALSEDVACGSVRVPTACVPLFRAAVPSAWRGRVQVPRIPDRPDDDAPDELVRWFAFHCGPEDFADLAQFIESGPNSWPRFMREHYRRLCPLPFVWSPQCFTIVPRVLVNYRAVKPPDFDFSVVTVDIPFSRDISSDVVGATPTIAFDASDLLRYGKVTSLRHADYPVDNAFIGLVLLREGTFSSNLGVEFTIPDDLGIILGFE